MKKVIAGILSFLLVFFSLKAFAASQPREVDSKGSYNMVMESPSNRFIIDVRTRAEYEFVGHPDMPNGVPNIPVKFYPGWEVNKDFIKKVEERYKKDDTLVTMCRSGKRARFAATLLIEAGFKNVLYMGDSFEGPKDEKGHRTVGGWKVNGLPYTYRLDEDLIYK
jgi:rhodanese-related sulfurtransferase